MLLTLLQLNPPVASVKPERKVLIFSPNSVLKMITDTRAFDVGLKIKEINVMDVIVNLLLPQIFTFLFPPTVTNDD